MRPLPRIITALDSNTDSQAVLTLLDMTAAFDTVDHSILLQRLQRSYLVTRWHGSHLTWLPGNSLFGLKIGSSPAVMFLTGFRKDPS